MDLSMKNVTGISSTIVKRYPSPGLEEFEEQNTDQLGVGGSGHMTMLQSLNATRASSVSKARTFISLVHG